MKIYLLWLVILLSVVSYSQQKCIVIRKNSKHIDTIQEHKRIKIETLEGETYWGRFTVVDSATIMMKGKDVPLNSILKIRRKSIGGSIAKPVVVTLGVAFVGIGVAGAVVGGYGILATVFYTPPGIPMILVPTISNNHSSKRWMYSIQPYNENRNFSNDVGLNKS